MNLGLGLIAADEYFKEGDRRQVRDYQQKLRDADLSILDDRVAATRSGYKNTVAEHEAQAQIRPGQTANTIKRQGLEADDLTGQAERQPAEIQTKTVQAWLNLAGVQNDYNNLPMSLQVKNDTLRGQAMTTADSLKQLPAKLARAATQGVIDQQGQQDVVLGTMGQLIARQDKAGALAFANEVAKQGNLLPNTNGKTFTDIIPVRKGGNGAQGDGYIFVTSDGDRRFTPVEAIGGAMQKMKSGKYKFIERDDGSIFAGDEGTGRGSIVQPGDPNISKSGKGGKLPASVQEANWVMANKDNPVAMAAWKEVRSLRGDRRQMFIENLMAKGVMGNEKPEQLSAKAEMYGKLFDEMQRTQGGGGGQQPTTGQNSWQDWTQ